MADVTDRDRTFVPEEEELPLQPKEDGVFEVHDEVHDENENETGHGESSITNNNLIKGICPIAEVTAIRKPPSKDYGRLKLAALKSKSAGEIRDIKSAILSIKTNFFS